MSITTSTSINEPKAPVCSRCGHPSSLMSLDANGKQHCFDGCPRTHAQPEEGALIGHDVFDATSYGTRGHADKRAIERLQRLGVWYSRESSPVVGAEETVSIFNHSGREDGRTSEHVVSGGQRARIVERKMRPIAEIDADAEKIEKFNQGQLARKSHPLEPVAEPSPGDGQKPLTAKKPEPEPDVFEDWNRYKRNL